MKDIIKKLYLNQDKVNTIDGNIIISYCGYISTITIIDKNNYSEVMAWVNDTKYWYLNGKLHRESGPAVVRADGSKFWYLNGKKLIKEEFTKHSKKNS